MLTLIIPFIETTIPMGLEENEHGVAHHVLLAKGEHKSQKTHWSIEIMAVNGIWYGASSAHAPLGGYCSPCTRTHPFISADDCIDYQYNSICSYFKREGKCIPPKPSFRDFKDSYPFNE